MITTIFTLKKYFSKNSLKKKEYEKRYRSSDLIYHLGLQNNKAYCHEILFNI